MAVNCMHTFLKVPNGGLGPKAAMTILGNAAAHEAIGNLAEALSRARESTPTERLKAMRESASASADEQRKAKGK